LRPIRQRQCDAEYIALQHAAVAGGSERSEKRKPPPWLASERIHRFVRDGAPQAIKHFRHVHSGLPVVSLEALDLKLCKRAMASHSMRHRRDTHGTFWRQDNFIETALAASGL
jgi:hypothetical protein